MKHLLYALALVMPCVPLMAAATATATAAAEPAIHPGDKPDRAPHHHQLIEVKFVLISPPPEPRHGPYFDFGDGRAAIRPQPFWDRFARPLNGGFMTPNMYWCSGWACRDFRH